MRRITQRVKKGEQMCFRRRRVKFEFLGHAIHLL